MCGSCQHVDLLSPHGGHTLDCPFNILSRSESVPPFHCWESRPVWAWTGAQRYLRPHRRWKVKGSRETGQTPARDWWLQKEEEHGTPEATGTNQLR